MQWPCFPGLAPIGMTSCWQDFIKSPKTLRLQQPRAIQIRPKYGLIPAPSPSLHQPLLVHTHPPFVCVCVCVCAHLHRVFQNLCTIFWALPHSPIAWLVTPPPAPPPQTFFSPLHFPLLIFYSGSFCEINSSLPIFGLSTQGIESFFKGCCSTGRETDWVVAFFWVGKEQD